ncbi:Vta1 like-domain-containing protein, partial [Rhizoctonia solani]
IPTELKHVGPFCTRAQEVRARDPIVCYWSLYYVAQLGLKRSKTPENQPFLAAVVEQLEIMKRSLRTRRQITDEAAGSQYVRRFGYNVFQAATNEDTQGQANR